MGASLIIERSTSKADIEAVLKHPDIYDKIADDSCPDVGDWDVDPLADDSVFLVGYVDDAPVAVMAYHKKDDWFCHVQVLPCFRCYAKEFGGKVLDWFFSNIGGPLYAIIPVCYPNVSAFAQGFGFEECGIADEYIKNGVSHQRKAYKLER